MNPHHIAYECAYTLVEDYPDRLTPEQYVQAYIATMRPEAADLEMIALACRVIEERI